MTKKRSITAVAVLALNVTAAVAAADLARPAAVVALARIADSVTPTQGKSEQAVIADIHAMRGRGMTLRQIAASLTQDHIPTKTGRSDSQSVQANWRTLQTNGAKGPIPFDVRDSVGSRRNG